MYKHKNKGYSLIEMIVYLAIFTSVSVLVINSFITVLGSFSATRTNRDLLESGAVVIERITREIRQAESIDTINSVFNSSPGALQLNSIDSGGSQMTIKFSVTNGAINLYEGGTLVGNLLGQNITATSLVFRRITTTNGEGVKIELTLQDNISKNLQTANFYNTIILRGGY